MRRIFFYILPVFLTENLWSQSAVLEKIVLYGNTRTKNHVILRELDTKEGSLFSNTLLLKDRAWLLRLDFLKRIEFQLKPGSAKDRHYLLLVVQEKGPWSVSPILNNNDLFGWYAGCQFTHRNLWGRRQQIDAAFQFGGIQRYSLSWNYPWFGGKHRLFASLDLYHTSFQYLYHDSPSSFLEKNTGVKITLGKGFGRNLRIGFRPGMDRFWSDTPEVTFSKTHVDDIAFFECFATFDSRDWPLYPRTGLYLQSGMQWFGVFQPHQFQKTIFDFRFYSPIYHDNILALDTYLEFSQGPIPVYQRMHLGGGKTIRGYSTGFLSGENGFFTSLEYRFPIFYERNPLAGINVGYAGVVFIDTGSAWYHHQTLKLTMLHTSFGLGLHAIWDRWVFRAEYGNHGTGWGFINLSTGLKF